METTVTGDSYVVKLAAFVRANEAVLSGSTGPNTGSSNQAGPSWLPAISTSSAPAKIIPPKPLQISLHHLSYLLLRFDALGLPVGKLDEPLPPSLLRSRIRQSTFSYISVQDTKARPKSVALDPETASIGSVRSALSRISVSAAAAATSSPTSWFSRPTPPDPDVELKRLYSAFTKLPALDVVPASDAGLIEGFDDQAVPTTLTPFDCFKNLQVLICTDVDPRTISGWDRLASQLKSLTINRGGLEDLEGFFIGRVAQEAEERKRDFDGDSAPPQAESSANGANNSTPELPSLAWHFLTHLALPSSSLTFFADLPMQSLRSLDLSHNLLNSIPPCLSSMPNLQSLDLTGNLIEDCRGASELLSSIRTLSLRGNRIEFLSGLQDLRSLRQIDLRENDVYEASEVGRLAQLPRLNHVWVRGNPVYEEYPDPRVEMFLEFAKDGWPLEGDPAGTLTLDGEACGYFERKRVAERLPLGTKMAPPGSRRGGTAFSSRDASSYDATRRKEREETPRAQEPSIVRADEPDSMKVVSVKRRSRREQQRDKDVVNADPGDGETTAKRLSAGGERRQSTSGRGTGAASPTPSGGHHPRPPPGHGSEKRRHRRIVNLDDDEQGNQSRSASPMVKSTSKGSKAEEISEAEKLKREVLSGGAGSSSGTVDANGPVSTRPTSRDSSSSGGKMKSNTLGRTTDVGGSRRPNSSTLAARRSKVTTSLYDPPSIDASAANSQTLAAPTGPTSPTSSTAATTDLRARIEGLKREVGDDWLRVLSRGGGGGGSVDR